MSDEPKPLTCMRAADKSSIAGIFGKRCGKPATMDKHLGPCCDECLAQFWEALDDRTTLGGIAVAALRDRLRRQRAH